MSILRSESVSKTFLRAGRAFRAVNGLDFELSEGEFVHIVGRSGSGKSTFLALLSGILTPSEGRVLFEGRDIAAFGAEEAGAFRNGSIGIVPQMTGTMPNLNVVENVQLPRMFAGETAKNMSPPEERAMLLLDMMGIAHLAHQFPRELSGGEIRRVMIARAMMNEPKIILADEPTSDLDRTNGRQVMELFRTLKNEGVSLVVVTHEQESLQYGDRVLELEDGEWKIENGKIRNGQI